MARQWGNKIGVETLHPGILPSRKKKQSLDDEFQFADELDPKLAREIADYEESCRIDPSKASNESKETLKRLEEDNAKARRAYRWPHQEELKGGRTGKILHMNEFMSRLRRALPRGMKVWLTEKGGMQKSLGLYIGHSGTLRPETCTHEVGKPHYVCFIQVPFMQEYEELFFDKYDVPLGPKRRGWRTILLKLIEQKVITEKAAHREFGEPSSGPASLRYREYLQYLRSRGIGLK